MLTTIMRGERLEDTTFVPLNHRNGGVDYIRTDEIMTVSFRS